MFVEKNLNFYHVRVTYKLNILHTILLLLKVYNQAEYILYTVQTKKYKINFKQVMFLFTEQFQVIPKKAFHTMIILSKNNLVGRVQPKVFRSTIT